MQRARKWPEGGGGGVAMASSNFMNLGAHLVPQLAHTSLFCPCTVDSFRCLLTSMQKFTYHNIFTGRIISCKLKQKRLSLRELLECFDWNINIKESVENLQKCFTRM
jgi:hypothetical protein